MEGSKPVVRLMRSRTPVAYPEALALMEREVELIAAGTQPELLWFLEHPPLITRGASGRAEHLIDPDRFPVYATDRGGQLTYHGPGQRVVYVMLDVRRRTGGDVRAFVRLMEACAIGALDRLGVTAFGDRERPGIWVKRANLPGGEAKIGAIGLKVRRGISLHGISLNVAPDLAHFDAIVACGIEGAAVTSLSALDITTDMESVDNALIESFTDLIGPLDAIGAPG